MLGSMARRAVASLPPAVRWRTRRALALARWCVRRDDGDDATAYDDEFWALHSAGDWDGFADLVLRLCAPRSIADVGCGDGKLLAAVRRRAPGVTVLGIDSSRPALARAAAAGVPVLVHDLSSTRGADLAELRRRVDGVDLVISLETAEHLPPWAASAFVDTLARGRLVVFSAAHPDQGGTLHLNERPAEYWRSRFAAAGYVPAAPESELRDGVRAIALPPWYAANIQMFERAR
jgi:SAM-dependent methyltransferase